MLGSVLGSPYFLWKLKRNGSRRLMSFRTALLAIFQTWGSRVGSLIIRIIVFRGLILLGNYYIQVHHCLLGVPLINVTGDLRRFLQAGPLPEKGRFSVVGLGA